MSTSKFRHIKYKHHHWTQISSDYPLMTPRQDDSFNSEIFLNLQKLLSENKDVNGLTRGQTFVNNMISFVLGLEAAKKENAPNQVFRFHSAGQVKEIYLSSSSWKKLQDWVSAEIKKSSILENRNIHLSNKFTETLKKTLSVHLPEILRIYTGLNLTEQHFLDISKVIIKTFSDMQHKQIMQKKKLTHVFFCNTMGEMIARSIYNKIVTKSMETQLREYLTNNNIEEVLKSKKFEKLNKNFGSNNGCKLMVIQYYLGLIDSIIANPKMSQEMKYTKIFNFSSENHLTVIEKMLTLKHNSAIEKYIKKEYVGLGSKLLSCFYLNELVLKDKQEPQEKGKKLKPITLTINTEELLIDVPTELPLIFPAKSENVTTKIGDKKIILRKHQSLIHNNLDVTGHLNDQQKNLLKERSMFYKTNLNFFVDFLELLRKSINSLKNLALPISREQEEALTVISHLYKINFNELLKSEINQTTKDVILNLIRYSVDFQNFKKPTNPKLPEYAEIIKILENKLRMHKISLNELLNSATIMSHFSYFSFGFFVDGRFRAYSTASALNLYAPLARNFISFYMPDNLKEMKKHTKIEKARVKSKIISLLTKQISEICPTYDPQNWEPLKAKIKLGELFNAINFVRDLNGFKKEPLNYRFLSFFSYDCSSSGLQNTGQIVRDKKVAMHSSITKSEDENITELYDMTKTFVKSKLINCCETAEFIKNTLLFNKLKEFAKFKSKNYEEYARDIYHLAHSDWGCTIEEKEKVAINANNFLFISVFERKCINWLRITYNLEHWNLEKATMILVRVIDTAHSINKMSDMFDIIFNRTLFKHPIMTLIYASTYFGRRNQFIKSFVKIMNTHGRLADYAMLKAYKSLIPFLDYYTVKYIKETLPSCLLLLEAFQKNRESSISVESPYFSFIFKPLEKKKLRFQRSRRRFTINLFKTTIDKKKFKSSFCPNFMQHADAVLVAIFSNLQHGLIPFCHFFTIHDRFFVNPVYCEFLKPVLKQAYLGFFRLDFLKCLQKQPEILKEIDRLKCKYNVIPLTENDYTHENFVKH